MRCCAIVDDAGGQVGDGRVCRLRRDTQPPAVASSPSLAVESQALVMQKQALFDCMYLWWEPVRAGRKKYHEKRNVATVVRHEDSREA